MMHSRPTLVSKPLIPHLLIIYLLPLPPATTVPCSWLSFCTSSFPLTRSGFFNVTLEVFEPETLNYFTFFRPILSTLSAFRNPMLTHLPLSGFMDPLPRVLIAPTPSLAFSPPIPRTLAAASSILSNRAYPFLNFASPFFLCSIPTLIM